MGVAVWAFSCYAMFPCHSSAVICLGEIAIISATLAKIQVLYPDFAAVRTFSCFINDECVLLFAESIWTIAILQKIGDTKHEKRSKIQSHK